MKRFAIGSASVVGVVGICAALVWLDRPSRAQSALPPSHMELVDAARLDAALAHLRELEQVARPYAETVNHICERYKIQPASLGKTVNVDYATGAISRPAPPAAGNH